MNINPTGECFTDCMELLEDVMNDRAPDDRMTDVQLVHAICIFPKTKKKRFAHGWIEIGPVVLQRGFIDGKRVKYTLPLKEFYRKMQVKDYTKYSVAQAIHENLKSNHYGPWLRRYRRLCWPKRDHPKHVAITYS